jgi:ribose 5-phosphate isomerase B
MIAIGSDHAGFRLKGLVMARLAGMSLECGDFGAYDEERVDYAPIGAAVAEAVAGGSYERGILLCGTGIGMSVTANKVPRVRAALCGDAYSAELSRKHNDANILVLGARVIGDGLALQILDAWLGAPFEGGRHMRRLKQISDVEDRYSRTGAEDRYSRTGAEDVRRCNSGENGI